MLTIIVGLIIIVIYVFLEVIKHTYKSNPKINGTLLFVQGILWTLMAIDNRADTSVKQTIYIVFILLSFIYGILEFIKCKQ